MAIAVINWSTTETLSVTQYTHTRVRVMSDGAVIAEQFIPFPVTTATFDGLAAGIIYIGDICLSNASGTVIDAGGAIGTGPFSMPLQFSAPKPVAATVVMS